MDENKKNNLYRTIMVVAVTAIITFLATTIITHKQYSGELNSNLNETQLFTAKVNSIRKKIDKGYIGEIKDEDLLEGAIKGYVSGLDDPYTEYFTKEEMTEYSESTNGNYVGIGIYMSKDTNNNTIVVMNTMKDSPAEKAGLKSGDIIYKVDDIEYDGDDYDMISTKIKGKEGTKVKIGIVRDGQEMSFDIDRKSIQVEHIDAKVIENDIGYMYISSFEGGVSTEFNKKYAELKSKNIKSLIIDIRNNGGGIVSEVLDIADQMTSKGETLLIEKDKDGKEKVEKASVDKNIDIQIVLIVNEYSASASEILAGILQEKVPNATVIGNTTYGKGVIQTLYTLTDGSGLKITTSEYFTPEHKSINKIGITPDEVVKLPEDTKVVMGDENDTQYKKAIELLKK